MYTKDRVHCEIGTGYKIKDLTIDKYECQFCDFITTGQEKIIEHVQEKHVVQ